MAALGITKVAVYVRISLLSRLAELQGLCGGLLSEMLVDEWASGLLNAASGISASTGSATFCGVLPVVSLLCSDSPLDADSTGAEAGPKAGSIFVWYSSRLYPFTIDQLATSSG